MSLPNFKSNIDKNKKVNEKYFFNFPFNEKTVREFLRCLVDINFFYRVSFEPETSPLHEIIKSPELNHGLRILSITENSGIHTINHKFIQNNYPVLDNEVFITINTLAPLAGGIFTFMMKRESDGTLRVYKKITHVRS